MILSIDERRVRPEARLFIGKEVVIVDSTDRKEVGIRGLVIDETKNTFLLLSGKREKMICKNRVALYFPREDVFIEGKDVQFRPEERVKKVLKRAKKAEYRM